MTDTLRPIRPICDLCGSDEGIVNVYVGGPFLALHPSCADIGRRAIRIFVRHITRNPYGFMTLLNVINSVDNDPLISKVETKVEK